MNKSKIFLLLIILMTLGVLLFTSTVFGVVLWAILPTVNFLNSVVISFIFNILLGYSLYVKLLNEIRQIKFDDINFSEDEDDIV